MSGFDEPDIVVLAVVLVLLVIVLIVHVFYYITLSKCLSRINPRNRDMEPGLVWLNFIPCFNLVWIFITISKIGSSLEKEYRWRRWPREGEGFGTGVGMAYAGLSIAGWIPYIGTLFGLGSFVCWIVYWVQIAGYSARLAAEPADEYRDDRFGDDDFDRDLPRGRRAEGPSDERIQSRDPDDRPPDERIQSRDW